MGMVVDQSCFIEPLSVPYGYIDSQNDAYPIVYPIHDSMLPVPVGDPTQWAAQLIDNYPADAYQQFNSLQLALFEDAKLGTLAINCALYRAVQAMNFDVEYARQAIKRQESVVLASRIKAGAIIENAQHAGAI